MTTMKISPDDIKALGETLNEISTQLERISTGEFDKAAYGPGSVGGALDGVIRDWELERGRLCQSLTAAGDAADQAALMYRVVEQGNSNCFGW